jgi:hypothetical protein
LRAGRRSAKRSSAAAHSFTRRIKGSKISGPPTLDAVTKL